MGLIIKSTESKKIETKGFDGNVTELESVYARVEAALRPDGKTIEVAFPYVFLSKEAYKLNAPIMQTNVPTSASGEALEQSLLTCHEVAKVALEQYGFEVEIDI